MSRKEYETCIFKGEHFEGVCRALRECYCLQNEDKIALVECPFYKSKSEYYINKIGEAVKKEG